METQMCKSCGADKSLDDFFNNSVKRNGKDSKCKVCRKSRSNDYRKENKEDLVKKAKDRYSNNREAILLNKAAYYEQHRESILASKVEYNVKNASKISKRVKVWRKNNEQSLRSKAKTYRNAVVSSVLAMLGHKCCECGEEEREFLTVDHINNDGNSERRSSWKRKILVGEVDPTRYRVMCHSCNVGAYRKNPVHHLSSKIHTGISRTCIVCVKEKDMSEFRSQESHSASVCLKCSRDRVMSVRADCFNKMGGVCKCCGQSDPYKLTVDHIDNNGSSKRSDGERSGIDIYRKIVSGLISTDGLQLLCWNCNYSKFIGNGFCFHQRHGNSLMAKPFARNKHELVVQENVDFDFNDVVIEHVGISDEIREFLDNNHYAGFGRPSSNVYVVKVCGSIAGVMKFAPPVRQGVAASIGLSNDQVIELDRFCIHPSRHKKNFATYMMGRVMKLVAVNNPNVMKIVSFADPRFGHAGTIYKASNWAEVGTTSRSYYYEDSDGGEINKKTLYEYAKTRKLTERKCAEALGYKKVHTPPKIKFVYDLKR